MFRNELMNDQSFNSPADSALQLQWIEKSQTISSSDGPPLMNRMAINQLTTFRWSLLQDLTAYRDHEIPAIGISWKKLTEFGVLSGIRKIQSSGLPVSNVSWVGGFTGQYGYSLDDAIAEAKRVIRIAGRLRAESVTVVTGPQNRHIDSHAARLVSESLSRLGDLAALYNVRLALQPMHAIYADDWTFLNGLEETLEILDRVAHPAVGLAFGAFHLLENCEILTHLEQFADRIALVTIADRTDIPLHSHDQCLPGEGHLPIRELITQLECVGYQGWYQTEVWSRDLWKLNHHDLIHRCRSAQLDFLPKPEDAPACGPVEIHPHY